MQARPGRNAHIVRFQVTVDPLQAVQVVKPAGHVMQHLLDVPSAYTPAAHDTNCGQTWVTSSGSATSTACKVGICSGV